MNVEFLAIAWLWILLLTVLMFIGGFILITILNELISLIFSKRKIFSNKANFLFSLGYFNIILFFFTIWWLYKEVKSRYKTKYFLGKFIIIYLLVSTPILLLCESVITNNIMSVFIVNGMSMAPTASDKEMVIVDKFNKEYRRWEIIIYKPWIDMKKEFFIKRIIAIGWDELKISDWDVYLKRNWEGEFDKLVESYLLEEKSTQTGNKEIIYQIPEWSFFIMWDNRSHSSDSRSCFSYSCNATTRNEFITQSEVVGVMKLHLWHWKWKSKLLDF